MTKKLGLKIASSALILPAALSLLWMRAAHNHHIHENDPPKPPEPTVIKKELKDVRIYAVKYYSDVYIFTNPKNPDLHCFGSGSEKTVDHCYPNGSGPKAVAGHPIDIEFYDTAHISNVLIFDDPENSELYCMRSEENSSTLCYAKPPVRPKIG